MDVVEGLREFGCNVDVLDPWADPEEIRKAYGFKSVKDISELKFDKYDAIVLAVSHRQFAQLDFSKIHSRDTVVFDIKGFLPREIVDGRL